MHCAEAAGAVQVRVGAQPEQFSDPVYNANAHVLLHEDTCFRFESQPQDGAFTVQLLEPDRSEVAPGELILSWGT